MHLTLRPLCLPLAVLAATALTACGSSSKDTAAPPQASGATSASTTSMPSPTPSPSPTLLTKAEFVAKIEAVCAGVTTRLDALPKPAGEQDYATLATFAQSTLALYPPYLKQVEALVARTADKQTLTANWLTLEKADFAAQAPALKKFAADAKAGNGAAVSADAQALDALPDHSEKIAGFMSGYGLKKCAALQSS